MNAKFDPQRYGPLCSHLIQAATLCELGPGVHNREVRSELDALTMSGIFDGQTPADEDMARCCLSGLWLLHNYLDESHRISQDVGTASGSFWHGIMHRREPDFSNAKYWFRRVGAHPVFADIRLIATELVEEDADDPTAIVILGAAEWDPFAFVDLCESATRGRMSSVETCQLVQQAEWQCLFDFCYHQAVS
jgi:hypothetical protein